MVNKLRGYEMRALATNNTIAGLSTELSTSTAEVASLAAIKQTMVAGGVANVLLRCNDDQDIQSTLKRVAWYFEEGCVVL